MEKVSGSKAVAPEAFFSVISFRMARIWWRSRVLLRRLNSVRLSVCRTRFSAE
jgi:hypothetical protein